MRYIALLTTAYIRGLPVSPVEGVQKVTDEEARHLVKAGVAEDVTEEMGGADEELARQQDDARGGAEQALSAAGGGRKPKPPKQPALPALEGLDIEQLRKVAADEGVDLSDRTEAADIVTLITDHRAKA